MRTRTGALVAVLPGQGPVDAGLPAVRGCAGRVAECPDRPTRSRPVTLFGSPVTPFGEHIAVERTVDHRVHIDLEAIRGQRDASLDAASDAVAVARTLDLPRLLALTLAKLAVSSAARGDLDAARVAMDEALRTSPPNISDASSAGVLLALSWVAILNGEYEAARERLLLVLDPSVTSSREVGWQMCFRVNLAWAELGMGNARQALQHAASVAVVVDRIGVRSWRLETLVVLAASLAECGDVGLAGVALGKAALAVKADHDAVDDYVINAYTTALAASEGPELAANMKRGTELTITEIATLVRTPAAVTR